MPSWIQGFAEHQPVTPVIATIRSLLLGTPAGSSPWQAPAWCAVLLSVSITLAGVPFRRRTW
jgi:ABC-2 type transport system permease protein